jgi:hypothetical protein
VFGNGDYGDDGDVTVVRAPRGAMRTCEGWPQEAAMRIADAHSLRVPIPPTP